MSSPLPTPRKYNKVRTKADIRRDPRVEELWLEESGWWVNLRVGNDHEQKKFWRFHIENTYSSCLHEDTIAELCRQLNEEVVLMSEPIEGGEP